MRREAGHVGEVGTTRGRTHLAWPVAEQPAARRSTPREISRRRAGRRRGQRSVTPPRGAVEYGIVAVAVIAIQALSFTTQPRITANGGRGYDGTIYYRMAERLAEGQPPQELSR